MTDFPPTTSATDTAQDATPRRNFVGRLVAGAAAMAATLGAPRYLVAAPASAPTGSNAPEHENDWMKALTGKHRTVFDLAAHRNGKPLAQAKNYLDAWRDAFQVPDRDVNIVIGVHGDGIPIVLTDALWDRFRIGEQYEVTDASTKGPAKRNVFTAANVFADGPVTGEQTVEALQRRGALFLVCMNTIANATRKLSGAGFGTPADVRAALLGGLVPGVITVPAMVVTLTQLQERGIKYVKIA